MHDRLTGVRFIRCYESLAVEILGDVAVALLSQGSLWAAEPAMHSRSSVGNAIGAPSVNNGRESGWSGGREGSQGLELSQG